MTIKLDIIKEKSITILNLYNEEDFLGSIGLNEQEDYYSINYSISRKNYEKFLYDFVLMYAYENDKYIMVTEENNIKNTCYNEYLRRRTSNMQKVKLPQKYKEKINLTNQEYNPELLYAYKLKATNFYRNIIVKKDNVENILKMKKLYNKYKKIINSYYEYKDNSWINEEYPLKEDCKSLFFGHLFDESYKMKKDIDINIDISNITVCDLTNISKNYLNNKGTRSKQNLIECIIDYEGDLIIFDGHHRFFEKIINKEYNIKIKLLFDERIGEPFEDAHRPDKTNLFVIDKNKKYSGLENYIDEKELKIIKNKLKNINKLIFK